MGNGATVVSSLFILLVCGTRELFKLGDSLLVQTGLVVFCCDRLD